MPPDQQPPREPAEPPGRADLSALLRWPALMAEEAMQLPETLRLMRELMAEQTRLLHNINDAAELMMRSAQRLEAVEERFSSVREAVDSSERIARLEATVGEVRDRMTTLAGRALDRLLPPSPPPSRPPPAPSPPSDE